MVTALQTLVTRQFDVFDPVVITVGSFHAGTTDNVIPDDATVPGDRALVLARGPRRVTDTALALVHGHRQRARADRGRRIR